MPKNSRSAWVDQGSSTTLDPSYATLLDSGWNDEEAERRVVDTASRLERLQRTRRHEWSEIYQRVSLSACVVRTMGSDSSAVRIGLEEGSAVRFRRLRESGLHFGATTGADDGALHLAVNLAEATEAHPSPDSPPSGTCFDRDGSGDGPSLTMLEAWLDLACELAGASGVKILAARIESATTLETWATTTGLRASRRRQRAWALMTSHDGSPPRIVASRDIQKLDPRCWTRASNERARSRTLRDRPAQVLLPPPVAAELVDRIARSLHLDPGAQGLPVGPGWRLVDDPASPDALFGGTFDDLGHRTRRVELADGSSVLAAISGPGHYRRPSFLDRPTERPANLVLDPPDAEIRPDARIASTVTIHPLPSGELVVELGGCGGWMRTTPRELVQRCTGGWGGCPVATHRGVVTPGLAFDELQLSG